MKKVLFLMLLLVLALGSSALAAEWKVGGDLGFYAQIPTAEGWESYDGRVWTQYELSADVTVSELTSAKLVFESFAQTDWDDALGRVKQAQVATKLPGIGTLAAGIAPDYSTNPFSEEGGINTIWGDIHLDDEYSPAGIAFASEKFAGFAGQIFLNPWSEDYAECRLVSGEITYDLPVLGGTTVGVAMAKWEHDDDPSMAVIAKASVTPNVTVYGEIGDNNGIDYDNNIFTAGAKATVGQFALVAEGDFANECYYLQASYPWHDLSLNASYRMGDGYGEDGYGNGLISFWTKVSF